MLATIKPVYVGAPPRVHCRLSGLLSVPGRLTGEHFSLGRVRLTALGCGNALWDSPRRDAGVGGATSTTLP